MRSRCVPDGKKVVNCDARAKVSGWDTALVDVAPSKITHTESARSNRSSRQADCRCDQELKFEHGTRTSSNFPLQFQVMLLIQSFDLVLTTRTEHHDHQTQLKRHSLVETPL